MARKFMAIVGAAFVVTVAGWAANDVLWAQDKVEGAGTAAGTAEAVAKTNALMGGEYRDLNFARRLKFASATLVNPDLAKNAVIAYQYEPTTFIEAVSLEEAEKLWRAGALGVASVKDGDWLYMSVDQDKDAFMQALLKKSSTDVVILASAEQFGPVEGKPVVSWSPEGKLFPAVDPLY